MKEKATVGAVAGGLNPETSLPNEAERFLQLLGKDPAQRPKNPTAVLGLLDPTFKETLIGNAQIREIFKVTKAGNVAGCMVTDGMVKRGAKVRLLRDNVVIHEGTLKTLRRFKDEVREVQHGFECGMAFESYEDMKVGDVIECFDIEEVKPSL